MLMVASLALVSCGTVKTSTATLEAKPQASPETQVAVATPPPAPTAPLVVKSPVVPDDPEPALVPGDEKPVAETAVVEKPVAEKPVAAKPVAGKKTPAIASAPLVTPDVADEPASPESKPVPAEPPAMHPAPPPPAVSIDVPEKVTEAAKAAEAMPAKLAEAPAAKPSIASPAIVSKAPDKPVAADAKPAAAPAAAEAPPTSITPPAATPEAAPSTTPAAEAAKDNQVDKAKPPSSIFASPSSWLKDPKALLQAKIGGFPLWLVVLLVLLAFISLVVGFRGKKSPPPATAEMGGGS